MRSMKMVMMGSGGVGGYYGARLQQADDAVAACREAAEERLLDQPADAARERR